MPFTCSAHGGSPQPRPGSTPSSIRVKTDLADCQTMPKIAMVISKADNRVGQGKSEPDTNGTRNNRKARQSVCARVIAIGNQCGAVDFAADADAEYRNGFVADEADETGNARPTSARRWAGDERYGR